jgi:hypothetical protein
MQHNLYIVDDPSVLTKTQRYNMPVYLHTQNAGQAIENLKSRIKMEAAFFAIKHSYHVILTDLDAVFRMDPRTAVPCYLECYFATQVNPAGQINTGCLYLKPTNATLAFFEEVLRRIHVSSSHYQVIINHAFKWWPTAFHMEPLAAQKFCSGLTEYLSHCVVYHISLIDGIASKVAKLKERGLWSQGREKHNV